MKSRRAYARPVNHRSPENAALFVDWLEGGKPLLVSGHFEKSSAHNRPKEQRKLGTAGANCGILHVSVLFGNVLEAFVIRLNLNP